MGSIKTRWAVLADARQIAQVHYDALADFHDFYAAFLATHPRDILPQATSAALARPSERFVVAVDVPSDKVVGFIRYNVEEGIGSEATASGPTAPAPAPTASAGNLFAPKEHMKDLWKQFNDEKDELDDYYKKSSQGKRHYLIKHLMVSPANQRHGIGARLLRGVLQQSDAEGIPAYIVASAEAYRLYAKAGFEDMGKFVIDNERWAREVEKHERELGIFGNEGLADRFKALTEVEVSMVRPPRPVSER